MKRYFAAIGLIAASVIYVIAQHAQGSDEHQLVVLPQGAATTTGETSPTKSQTNLTSDSSKYKDGTYTGTAANAFYGYVQVRAVVSGGKLMAVNILQYPNDRSTSRFINSQALPVLEQEAIKAQSANVNTVSGASDTSGAFRESLSSALAQA